MTVNMQSVGTALGLGQKLSFTHRIKYVILDISGIPTPIIFPAHLRHDGAVLNGKDALSAGYCEITPAGVMVYGGSTSLGLTSKNEDAEIIKRALGL